MIKVNNKKAIRHVADISFKAEKSRNLFAIIAIILTTVLFSGLFTIGSNLLSSMEESTMRQVGGSAHAGFKNIDEEKYDRLKAHPLIDKISYSVLLGFAENTGLNKRPTEIRYVNDEKEAGWMFSMPSVGRLPEKTNELATDTLVLNALGVEPRLGELVDIKYSVGGDEYEETFDLVGFWEGDVIASASLIWLSRDYVTGILEKYDEATLEYGVGNIFADVMLVNKNNAEEKMHKIITDSGYSENDIEIGINWAYLSSMKMDSGTMLGIIAAVLIIVFCGYLIISNIFLISVSNDIRFYGLLKTIGTTGKQLKTLIKRQAFLMCLISIPIGCILGIVVGMILTPAVLNTFNVNVINVKFNPLVFLLTAVFSTVTVWISIRRALKAAARVSPIDALKTTDGIMNMKRTKARSGAISIFRMALSNIRRNSKKTVFVVISLSLSLLALNIAYSMADSFDMEKYLKGMISHDFVIGDVSWFNVYLDYTDQDTLSDEFITELMSVEGIDRAGAVYFHEEKMRLGKYWDGMAETAKELNVSNVWYDEIVNGINTDSGICHLYGLDDAIWDDVEVLEGELDLEKLKTGKYVVTAPYNESETPVILYRPGDIVDLVSDNGDEMSMEVLAVAILPYNLSIKHFHPDEADFLMPSDVFKYKIKNKPPMIFTCDVMADNPGEGQQASDVSRYDRLYTVDEFLKSWCEADPNMQYASRATYIEEYKSTQRMFKSVGIVVSALLGLIGIANFANTIITSVTVRKRELAILESVGMTKRQQNKLIIFEGLSYVVFSLICTLTAGTVISVAVLKLMLGTDGYFTARYAAYPALIISPAYILISIVISMAVIHFVNKKSVVERLRYVE